VEEEEDAIHFSLPLVVEPEKSNSGPSLFSFTWKQSISLSLSLSHLGKQILCLIMWQADEEEEEEEVIHLSLIVESNPLSDVEAAAEGETIISLSLTCGNDPLSHVEAEEAAIISLALSLSYV
jgi:hypothetical protein